MNGLTVRFGLFNLLVLTFNRSLHRPRCRPSGSESWDVGIPIAPEQRERARGWQQKQPLLLELHPIQFISSSVVLTPTRTRPNTQLLHYRFGKQMLDIRDMLSFFNSGLVGKTGRETSPSVLQAWSLSLSFDKASFPITAQGDDAYRAREISRADNRLQVSGFHVASVRVILSEHPLHTFISG